MTLIGKAASAIALSLALATSAQAATVKSGGTQVGTGGAIAEQNGLASIASNNGLYFGGSTAPDSDWVWVGDVNDVDSVVFEFTFDLAGYDVTTASLSGLWGVDNVGTVSLNGTVISTLAAVTTANFNALTAYGTSLSSLFNAGMNTLTFALEDRGGQAAFRATATVTADLRGTTVDPVPLPAGAVLLLGGLGALALTRRRKA